MREAKSIAIVGATGAVGQEMLLCLEQRDFPIRSLTLLASARSAGKKIKFKGEEITIRELTHDAFEGIDIALFAAGGNISKEYAESAVKAGAIVVDNSSAFRDDPAVPLIVPEINGKEAQNTPRGIIANPNCSTTIAMMALAPLNEKFGLKRLIASTYQAVSGSGAQGLVELDEQIHAVAEGRKPEPKLYPHAIVSNVIPEVDSFTENGYTREELKMLYEGRKILDLPELEVSCTCVRVPVMRSHSMTLTAQFEREPSVEEARAAYNGKPGVAVRDNPEERLYPVPSDTSGKDDCLVGRIRRNIVLENALDLWAVGDQLRKGAALNAVQIAELL